jgi:hypothetical protein
MPKIIIIFILLSYFLNAKEDGESCSELYRKIKTSECGKKIFHFLEGAEAELGFGIIYSELEIEHRDKGELAIMQGGSLPMPYVSINFPMKFIGKSLFSYSFSLGYKNLFGSEQLVVRNKKEKNLDLDGYFMASNFFVTPSIHYVFGNHKIRPDLFASFGIGLGAGLSKVKGVATQTQNLDDLLCRSYIDEYMSGEASIDQIRSECEPIRYDVFGFGLSGSVQVRIRIKKILFSLGLNSIQISSQSYHFTPSYFYFDWAYLLEF